MTTRDDHLLLRGDPPFIPRYVGARVARKEERRLLDRSARFVDELQTPGILHLALVRSTEAHATIEAIDVGEVRTLLFETAVFTASDLGGPVPATVVDCENPGFQSSMMPILASGKATLADYRLPSNMEVPDIEVVHLETLSPRTTYWIKGMGEGGAIAPMAANADADEVGPDRGRGSHRGAAHSRPRVAGAQRGRVLGGARSAAIRSRRCTEITDPGRSSGPTQSVSRTLASTRRRGAVRAAADTDDRGTPTIRRESCLVGSLDP